MGKVRKTKRCKTDDGYMRRVWYSQNPNVTLVSIPCEFSKKLGISQGDVLRVKMLGSCVVFSKEQTNEADRRAKEID